MLKLKLATVFLLVVVLIVSAVHAQDGNGSSRTVIVDSLETISQHNLSVRSGESITYRLRECPDNLNAPCSVTVTASTFSAINEFNRRSRYSRPLLSTVATLVCGRQIYNGFGVQVGYLEEKATGTFYNQTGRAPFSWNSLPDTSGTWASVGYSWSNISSQISPGVGVYAATSGWAKTTATFNYPGGSTGQQVLISVTTSGWTCS